MLLVLTGLQIGELLALRWGNIDLSARFLGVCETVYDGRFDQPKTKRSVRTPLGIKMYPDSFAPSVAVRLSSSAAEHLGSWLGQKALARVLDLGRAC